MAESSAATAASSARAAQEALEAAKRMRKFKQRSMEISQAHLDKIYHSSRTPAVILFGDSLIERMTTTGISESLKQWPSVAMMSALEVENISCDQRWDYMVNAINRYGGLKNIPTGTQFMAFGRIGDILNAGCGGDHIENMLLRLVGNEETNLTGLIEALSIVQALSRRPKRTRLWVVHAGTNNLHKTQGMPQRSIEAMRVLLTAILQASAPRAHILLTGLFYRTDVPDPLIDQANIRLRRLVDELAQAFPGVPGGTAFLAPEDPPAQSAHRKGQSTDSGLGSSEAPSNEVPLRPYRHANPVSGDSGTSDIDPGRPEETVQLSEKALGKRPTGLVIATQGIDRQDFGSKLSDTPVTQGDNKQGTGPGGPDERRDSAISAAFSNEGQQKTRSKIAGDSEALPRGFDPTMPQFKRNDWDIPSPPDFFIPRILFLNAADRIDTKVHLEDHVHLNLEGYREWMKILFPMVMEFLGCADEMSRTARQHESQHAQEGYAPKTRYGTIIMDRAEAAVGRPHEEHEGPHWIKINRNTVKSWTDALREGRDEEGKVLASSPPSICNSPTQRFGVAGRHPTSPEGEWQDVAPKTPVSPTSPKSPGSRRGVFFEIGGSRVPAAGSGSKPPTPGTPPVASLIPSSLPPRPDTPRPRSVSSPTSQEASGSNPPGAEPESPKARGRIRSALGSMKQKFKDTTRRRSSSPSG